MQRINFNLKTLIITIFLILKHLTVISQEITYTYIDNTTFKDPLSLPYAPFESHPSNSYQANTFNYTESQYIPFEEERNRPIIIRVNREDTPDDPSINMPLNDDIISFIQCIILYILFKKIKK
jgi:hypothetical protein